MFIIISAITLSQCLVKDFINEKVYEKIHQTLIEDYPDQKVKTDCLINYYKEMKLADEFYTFDIIINPNKVRSAVQQIVEEAHFTCSLAQFLSSFFGIFSVSIAVIIVCLICTMGRKVYQKCCRKPEYVNVREVYFASNKVTEL